MGMEDWTTRGNAALVNPWQGFVKQPAARQLLTTHGKPPWDNPWTFTAGVKTLLMPRSIPQPALAYGGPVVSGCQM